MAGKDTTLATLEWAVAELVRNLEKTVKSSRGVRASHWQRKTIRGIGHCSTSLFTSNNQRNLPATPTSSICPSQSRSRRSNLCLHCTKGCAGVGECMGHWQRPHLGQPYLIYAGEVLGNGYWCYRQKHWAYSVWWWEDDATQVNRFSSENPKE